jgi:hypothetical protein
MNRSVAIVSSLVLCSGVAVCQYSASLDTSAGTSHLTMRFRAESFGGSTITGAPYSAEEVDENQQTLADGTHITQLMPTVKKYRDSMGRTRTERQPFNGAITSGSQHLELPMLVEIEDPVAQFRYVLDPERNIAHRVEIKLREERSRSSQSGTVQSASGETVAANGTPGSGPATASASGAQIKARTAARSAVNDALHPKSSSESLGTETMEGVIVEGRRGTTTWPTGAVGNDRPLIATYEYWHSPTLKLEILSTSDDPRSGQHTHKVTNLNTSEPDAALFQPPPGYTVKDETGEFEISWPTPQR